MKEKNNYLFDSGYMAYMEGWITKRLAFLDNEFNYTTAIPSIEKNDIQYPCEAYIYNTNGQLVKTVNLTTLNNKMLYSGLNKGVYIVRFQNQTEGKVKKLIVRK